jgi:hypothetical protein
MTLRIWKKAKRLQPFEINSPHLSGSQRSYGIHTIEPGLIYISATPFHGPRGYKTHYNSRAVYLYVVTCNINMTAGRG